MPQKGYTLVELIVAVGLFTIVMTLAAGAYLVTINLNRRVQSISNGVNNASFAIETMERDIRTGKDYACPSGASFCVLTDPTSCAASFSFKRPDGQPVAYCLGGTAPNRYIERYVNGLSTGPLTDVSAVAITSLFFYVFDTQKGNMEPPHLIMIVSGHTQGKDQVNFTVETGATMRGTDI